MTPIGKPPSGSLHQATGWLVPGPKLAPSHLDGWVGLCAVGEYERIANQSNLSWSSASSRPFGVYPWMANPS